MDSFRAHNGLGDDIEYVAKKFRLDRAARRVANFLGKEDCNCEGRKKKANKLPSLLKHIK
jgi:hypothetical protein